MNRITLGVLLGVVYLGRRRLRMPVSFVPWRLGCRQLVPVDSISDGVQDKSAECSALSHSCGPDRGSFVG